MQSLSKPLLPLFALPILVAAAGARAEPPSRAAMTNHAAQPRLAAKATRGTDGTTARPSEGAAEPAPAPPPPPPAPPVAPHVESAWVHIDGPARARLQREDEDGDWVTVCSAPCDQRMPVDERYRIGGTDVKASKPFTLRAGDDEHVTLTVDAASHAKFVVGAVAAGAGAALAVDALGVGPVGDSSHPADWTLAGVSAAVAVVGAIMLSTNWSTSVSQDGPASRAPAASDASATPAWRDASAEQRGFPRAAIVPVLFGAF